jgi:hypothetical protein
MFLATSIFFGMAMFIPLSNTHARPKQEYGDSYTEMLDQSADATRLNGLWEAQFLLARIERKLKSAPASTPN